MNLFDLCVYKNLNKGSGGDVDVSSLVATENKTYNAGDGKAYNPVVVNVPTPPPSLQSLTASHNGYFVPSSGYDGFDEVTVEVATPLETLNATENGTYTPSSGYEGFSEVTVDVPLPNNAYLLESQKNDVVTIQHGAEFDMPKLIASIEPQQSGSGDPSPENVRPISGWDEVNVSVSGVNVWDEEWFLDGNYRLSSKNYIPVKANTEYFFGNTLLYSITCYDINKNSLGGASLKQVPNIGYKFTTKPNTYYIKFNVGSSYGATYNNDISINYPSTDTSYHAYNGHTYTINLDGTRYGGKLDVVSGVLTLTHGFISSYNGETLPSTWISDRDVYAEGTTPTIGAEVCYKLATPQTYQLTPTQVKSLLGVNNIWADTGEVDVQIWTKEVTS